MRGLARRIAFAPVVLVAVAVVIYGGLRILRPDLYPPGDPVLGGIVHDLDRALLHLDLGCAPPGGTGSGARPSGTCLPVRVLWQRGMAADIWLLVGSIVVGGVGGVLGGLMLRFRAAPKSVGFQRFPRPRTYPTTCWRPGHGDV